MGVAISTIILFFGTVAAAILSIVAGSEGAKDNWDKAEMWSAISGGIALTLVLLTFTLVVLSRTMPGGEIASLFESFGVGVMIAYILLLFALMGGVAGNIFGVIYARRKDKKKLEISTIVTGVGLIIAAFISLIPIVFLI